MLYNVIMKTPQMLAPRTVYVNELSIGNGQLQSTYTFTDSILPMDPFPYINVPQSLRLVDLSEQERLERIEAFSKTTPGLNRATSAALRAGLLHQGIDRINLIGETATIISRADNETTAIRTELAMNLERAVGGFTFGLISLQPQQPDERL